MSFQQPLILSFSEPSLRQIPRSPPISAGSMNPQTPSATSPPSPCTSSSPAPASSFSASQAASVNGSNPQTPPLIASDANSLNGAELDNLVVMGSSLQLDVDPQIIEALKSKDRIYVLKLGELMEGLIKERRARVDLTPATSYQRLLVHRCSAYYKLVPENDPVTKGIAVLPTPDSRIPERRICELVPPESTSQPTFKIMRRSISDRRNKPQSQAGSVAGEDADLSDVELSEAGSLGGRSNATGSSSKKRMTIEEREAAYNEARSRIFMGFEEKDKGKDKDLNASSSSLSLVSGSASTSANGDESSIGDVDDAISSPATESEWSGPSGPVIRDRKDNRRGGSGNASASSSTRSLRSGAPPYLGNGSTSTRNSRAPSPSFTYASLYEPAPSPHQLYDPSQPPNQMNTGYHATQYYLPYSPPGQSPNQPYMAPYTYYAPYNVYQQPSHDPQHHSGSDSSLPQNVEHYPHAPPMNYGNPYLWQPPNQPPLQSPPHMQQMSMPPQQHHQPAGHSMTSPPPHSPQYPYMPPSHSYGYPIPGYYPPPPPMGQHMPPPLPAGVQQPMYDLPRSMNGSIQQGINNLNGPLPTNGQQPHSNGRGNLGNGIITPNVNGRSNSRIAVGSSVGNNSNNIGGKPRPAPQPGRSPWSYGPGIGMGGYTSSSSPSSADAIGPRLNTTRRTSGNTASSPSTSLASSNGDEVSSTASSSTTSSSSRRTYTSTTSSQHPLPPRPDWAVGLKPQPTLAGRHHDHSLTNSRTMSPISPPRNLNGSNSSVGPSPSRKTPPVSLQSTDFPPLTPLAPAPEKRNPIPTGAWGNSSTRSILSPTTGPGGNSLAHHRPDETERGNERPSPKTGEFYNPKFIRRTVGNDNAMTGKEKDGIKLGDAVTNAILVAQIQAISIEETTLEKVSLGDPSLTGVAT